MSVFGLIDRTIKTDNDPVDMLQDVNSLVEYSGKMDMFKKLTSEFSIILNVNLNVMIDYLK